MWALPDTCGSCADLGCLQHDGASCLPACRTVGSVALGLYTWFVFALGCMEGRWEEDVVLRWCACGLRGLQARRCGGRRVALARHTPGVGCQRRRRKRRQPRVLLVDAPLSVRAAFDLEVRTGVGIVGLPIGMRALRAGLFFGLSGGAAWAVRGMGGESLGGGDEEAASLEPRAVGVFGESAVCVDSGHAASEGTSQENVAGAAWHVVARRRVPQEGSHVVVGAARGAVADVRLHDGGSLLGTWGGRCFQIAVLHSFVAGLDGRRAGLFALLASGCENNAPSAFHGSGLARRNMQRTVAALVAEGLGVWVLFATSEWAVQRGRGMGRLYLGAPGARRVGVVAWLKREAHAVALEGRGCDALLLAAPVLDRCPWDYGAVGAPKKRTGGFNSAVTRTVASDKRWAAQPVGWRRAARGDDGRAQGHSGPSAARSESIAGSDAGGGAEMTADSVESGPLQALTVGAKSGLGGWRDEGDDAQMCGGRNMEELHGPRARARGGRGRGRAGHGIGTSCDSQGPHGGDRGAPPGSGVGDRGVVPRPRVVVQLSVTQSSATKSGLLLQANDDMAALAALRRRQQAAMDDMSDADSSAYDEGWELDHGKGSGDDVEMCGLSDMGNEPEPEFLDDGGSDGRGPAPQTPPAEMVAAAARAPARASRGRGKGRGRRGKGAGKVRRAIEDRGLCVEDEEVWRRYTPAVVDAECCLARVPAGFRGAQCPRRVQAVSTKRLCAVHGKKAPFGLVTGPIPGDGLLKLMRAEARAQKGAAEEAGLQRRAGQGNDVEVRPRAPRARNWFFTRYHFWREAQRAVPGLVGLEELDASQFERCLKKTHELLRMHPSLVRRGGRDTVQKGKGPRSAADFHGTPERMQYNGEDGGRMFQWYDKGLFLQELQACGVGLDTCTETVCMDALRAVSKRGRMHHSAGLRARLVPFAGPQCFPQVQDRERLDANASSGAMGGTGASPGGVQSAGSVAADFRECWMQCDCCRRLRFVERHGMEALTSESYRRRLVSEGRDWKAWLIGASARWADFQEKRLRTETEKAEQEAAVLDRELEELMDKALAEGHGSAGPLTPDESDGSGGSGSEGASEDEVKRASLNGEPGVVALEEGGGRTGEILQGINAVLKRRLRRASDAALTAPRQLEGRDEFWTRGAGDGTRVLFTCSMLMRREASEGEGGESGAAAAAEGPQWAVMRCEDVDDFAEMGALPPAPEGFQAGEDVFLLDGSEAAVGPGEPGWYARHAWVVSAVPVQAVDAQKQRANFQGTWKLVVRVASDAGRGWRSVPEVHVEFVAGESTGRILRWPEPWDASKYAKGDVDVRSLFLLADGGVGVEGRRGIGAALRPVVRVVSWRNVSPRVPKFDVALREAPLWAVRAMHTITSRMVRFRCWTCHERFPAFHPAYEPPSDLSMEMLRPGVGGVATCDVAVAMWHDLPRPPLEAQSPLAEQCTGICRRCWQDELVQRKNLPEDADEGQIVPLRSHKNRMDPCWCFPRDQLEHLFRQATTTEAMLVALEHMQVSFVTATTTRLHKFRKNVISFPQDSAEFFRAMCALRQYRVADRVNSNRGPGEDVDRPVRRAVDATADERERWGVDGSGLLVFPARVVEVLPDGRLVLVYDGEDGRGLELPENVTPRVQMPWHPRYLKGCLVIMLRRSLGRGVVLEGLEVRWPLVCRLLQALTHVRADAHWVEPRYAEGIYSSVAAAEYREGRGGPMHRWYDPRLFDVLGEREVLESYAPRVLDGEVVSAERAQELLAQGQGGALGAPMREVRDEAELAAAGFDVRYPCAFDEARAIGERGGDLGEEVAMAVFMQWVELRDLRLGEAVAQWWVALPFGEEGDVEAWKVGNEENLADLYRRVVADVRAAAGQDEVGAASSLELRASARRTGGVLTAEALAFWCRDCVGEAFQCVGDGVWEELLDDLRMELAVVGDRVEMSRSTGTVEGQEPTYDVEEESERLAQKLVHGWPAVEAEPTPLRAPGRFVKSFPLEFPMGVADLFEARPRGVRPEEWAQHLLRYHTGHFVDGARGHRVVWAIVNTVLILEAGGKGFAVQRNVMRRLGGRFVRDGPLTRQRLRRMMEDEETCRLVVHQLMTVGKDVRSTPMQWAYEKKVMDACVKHLSWAPPWVESAGGGGDDAPGVQFLGANHRVADRIGLGRIPGFWWTLNCNYNQAHEIHRLNTEGRFALEALSATGGHAHRHVRYDFVRDSPDLAAWMIALRTELHMKVVMPAVVPHGGDARYLTMGRFETGPGGNPHTHGFSVGEGNPVLGRVRDNVQAGGPGDEPPGSESGSSQENEGGLAKAAVEEEDEEVEEEEEEEEEEGVATTGEGSGGENGMAGVFEVGGAVGTPAGKGLSGARARRRRGSASGGTGLGPRKNPEGVELLSDKEREFWNYFRRLVSEWNPCRDDDGVVTYRWDEEVAAHDMEVLCDGDRPQGVSLRVVLERALDGGADGKVDLEPVRRLVAALVQKSGRHDRHGMGAPEFGKHSCARGKPGCPCCRYGFPFECRSRRGPRPCALLRGDREGQWNARFPRNDPLCNSYEAHVLLGNMGNVDWRPCLNLWAVVEYVLKYAAKAPSGSRRMGDVLRDAIAEVAKYAEDKGPEDYLRRCLQKFYARTLGERDYGIFEAVHLGLRLPLVIPLLPVVSLSTSGARALKSAEVLAREATLENPAERTVAWESKLDKFDKRLALVRGTCDQSRCDADARSEWEEAVKHVSTYEFFWKFVIWRNRLRFQGQDVALMVTPAFSADCAHVQHAAHGAWARSCVVAFWRLMSTAERYEMLTKEGDSSDVRLWGGTVFVDPPSAGAAGRYLGVQDLSEEFENDRRREVRWSESLAGERVWRATQLRRVVPYGWELAVMEMLVDPLLQTWVPHWVVEQYERWNCHFRASVRVVLRRDKLRAKCNRELLTSARARMIAKKGRDPEENGEGGETESGEGENAGTRGGDDDFGPEDGDDETKAVLEVVRDAMPGEGVIGGVPSGSATSWARLGVEEQLSSAGPAEVTATRVAGERAVGDGLVAGEVNPRGYVWESFAAPGHIPELARKWKAWKAETVDAEVDAVGPDRLDAWQRFAFDIAEWSGEQRRARKGSTLRLRGFHPLRLILTGTAGTGKSRTVRAIVRRRRERESRDACLLAAPTGCASFLMKYGAATVHRSFGIPVGCCGPVINRQSKAFLMKMQRMRQANLFVLDEFSMIGRQMMGKICFKVEEALGSTLKEYGEWVSMRGKDVILAGDVKQAQPVGDDPMYKEGAYTGKGLNKPRNADARPGTPTIESLTTLGTCFRDEFTKAAEGDVVFLQRVHRVERESVSGMSASEADAYAAEAERFVDIVGRLADCTWTREDHAWLQRRNRSALSPSEVRDFSGAPLLMDGRKRRADGTDGADQVNERRLRRVAEQDGVPILCCRSYDQKPTSEPNYDTTLLDADQFRGLRSALLLCVGARVMLHTNEWVEAGLMNGAMGTVIGFMWEPGGDPHSPDTTKQAPYAVVVEFDDVDLGTDEGAGAPREFFPAEIMARRLEEESGMTQEEKEKERKRWRRVVPIVRTSASCEGDENVSRTQFPLTLAWALTHWKAQGMSLAKARVNLSRRTAGVAGVGFVAITRVKHPRGLMFEEDLPDYDAFMEAREKPVFRSRVRYEMLMRVKASETLRKYATRGVVCAADPWTLDEASRADRLLGSLRAVAGARRAQQGRDPKDWAAWLWQGEVPSIQRYLREAAERLGEGSDAEREAYEAVARRFWDKEGDAGVLHEAAAKYALGCLVSPEMHPSRDGVRLSKRQGGAEERGGAALTAGKWRVRVSEESAIAEGRVSKGVLEFFRMVLQRVCDVLRLSVLLGTAKLGQEVVAATSPEELQAKVRPWQHFQDLRKSAQSASEFVLPLLLDDGNFPKEVMLATVQSAEEGVDLGRATCLRVCVGDRLKRAEYPQSVARMLSALLHDGEAVEFQGMEFPSCTSGHEVCLAALGLLVSRVAAAAGVAMPDAGVPSFVADFRAALRGSFAALREEADRRADRDVMSQLVGAAECRKFLEALGSAATGAGSGAAGRAPAQPGQGVQALQVEVFEPLRVVAWNVAGLDAGHQYRASSWTRLENLEAVQLEVLRWQADLVALQECPSEAPLPLLVAPGAAKALEFVGAAKAHHGWVHLYAARVLGMKREEAAAEAPWVVGGMPGVSVVAVHLHPGPASDRVNVEARLKQVRAVFGEREGAVVCLGDCNAREEEVVDWRERCSCREAQYDECTWDPRRNPYCPDVPRGVAPERLDRCLYRGGVCVQVFVVGHARVFKEGRRFALSDHYALLGLLDLHQGHNWGSRGDASSRAAGRRVALGVMRNAEHAKEQQAVRSMNDEARERALFERAVVDEESAGVRLERMRREVKVLNDRRRELWQGVFGEGGLFSQAVESKLGHRQEVTAAPQVTLSREVERGAGERGGGAGGEPRIGVLLGMAPVIDSLVQVLVRLPSFMAALRWHGVRCGLGSAECAACSMLQAARVLGDEGRSPVGAWAGLPAGLLGGGEGWSMDIVKVLEVS